MARSVATEGATMASSATTSSKEVTGSGVKMKVEISRRSAKHINGDTATRTSIRVAVAIHAKLESTWISSRRISSISQDVACSTEDMISIFSASSGRWKAVPISVTACWTYAT